MKQVFVFALLIVSICSCKKNNDAPQFQSYIRFKLDAVQTECNQNIDATYLPPSIGPDNIITISGDFSGGSIALKINNAPVVLTATQYPFGPGTLRSGEIWTTGPTGRYYIAGDCSVCSGTSSGQITITEISAEYVKGNFDFITWKDAATNTFKTVTNGEFHIKR